MSTSSFGTLCLDYLYRASELPGIGSRSTRWQVLAAFLKAAEGRAERLVEHRNGVLLLQSILDRPHSGAIYLYSEPHRSFYMLSFDRDDDFSGHEFDDVFEKYNLERLIAAGLPGDQRRIPHHRRSAKHRPRQRSQRNSAP